MKNNLQSSGQLRAGFPVPLGNARSRWAGVFVGALLCAQVLGAGQLASGLSALPETSFAANYVTALTSAAIPSKDSLTPGSRVAISLIETGFLIGTTTAVHELGHARRVRAVGGHSKWETGDVNWWSYFTHRDPLAAGTTDWQLPGPTSLDAQISILAGGFNATTTWDESVAGSGPLGLVTARFSTLFYEFAGIKSSADDLSQIENLYRMKGYQIPRREMQCWQLLAGFFGQMSGSVKTYAYFTPKGVSLRAVSRWNDWTVATETIVHGAATVEVELGRRLCIGSTIELLPKVLVSSHGLGGSLKAGARFRHTTVSIDGQLVNRASLLGARSTTNLALEVSTQM